MIFVFAISCALEVDRESHDLSDSSNSPEIQAKPIGTAIPFIVEGNIPELIHICSSCDLVADWSAIESWSDGTVASSDNYHSEVLVECFYLMSAEDFESLDVVPSCPTTVQAPPFDVENRSVTIPAAANPGAQGGVIAIWVNDGNGHISEKKYIVGDSDGTTTITFE